MKCAISLSNLVMLCMIGSFSLNGMEATLAKLTPEERAHIQFIEKELAKLTPDQWARIEEKKGITHEEEEAAIADLQALEQIYERMTRRLTRQLKRANEEESEKIYAEDVAKLKPQDQALFKAIKEGNAAGVDAALKAGADKDLRLPKTGMTPVSLAIQGLNQNILGKLLDAGATPEVNDAYNVALSVGSLIWIGQAKSYDIIVKLLEKHRSKAAHAVYDDAALLAAARAAAPVAVAQKLIPKQAPVAAGTTQRPMPVTPPAAVAQKHAPVQVAAPAEAAAQRPAPATPAAVVSNPALDAQVNVLLAMAKQARGEARAEKIAEIKGLINQGANPNAVNSVGWSVLMRAILLQDEGLVDLLISKGAKPTENIDMAFEEVSSAFAKKVKNKLAGL